MIEYEVKIIVPVTKCKPEGVPIAMKMEEIKELISLIDESSIDEFTYESDDTKIKMKKQSEGNGQVSNATVQQPSISQQETRQPEQPVPAAQERQEDKEESAQESSADYDHEILSPMVGTFYSSPNPESDSFVTIGEQVNESTVVCIVEAMKLFNEIEAEVKGKIVEMLVENGELVEFGQPLFRVKSE